MSSTHGFIQWNKLLKLPASGFAWKFFLNKLTTNDWAQSIGICVASGCSLCQKHQETADHLFFYSPLQDLCGLPCSMRLPRKEYAQSSWTFFLSYGNRETLSSSRILSLQKRELFHAWFHQDAGISLSKAEIHFLQSSPKHILKLMHAFS